MRTKRTPKSAYEIVGRREPQTDGESICGPVKAPPTDEYAASEQTTRRPSFAESLPVEYQGSAFHHEGDAGGPAAWVRN